MLDLNPTNATDNGTLGLALPRVELTSTTSYAPLKTHVAGMTVYNTKTLGDVTPGTYYNDGTKWIRIGSGTLTAEVDGIVGNEITDTIAGGGLTRAGSGTAASPYKVGIKDGGVTTAKIADQAVSLAKIVPAAVTDTNAILTSTGGVVRWGFVSANDTVHAATYTGSSAVTFTKVYDADVTLNINAFSSANTLFPSGATYDICVGSRFAGLSWGVMFGRLYVFNNTQWEYKNQVVHLRCYRPSL
jgi:hypothetical protein